MSLIDQIRGLPGLVASQMGTRIRVSRFAYVGENGLPQEAYNAATGVSQREPDGLYETRAMAPAPDVEPAMGDLRLVEGTLTIPVDQADSGAYFDAKRNDIIEFLDGPLAGTIVLVDYADFVTLGGGRRVMYRGGSGAQGSIGAGTETD
ncbi:MAG: hypothetical protein AAFR96_09335 [Planctomycetota bacterium]